MKSQSDINESSGECTLAACSSPHSAATNLLEMQNYSFGEEFTKSSFRQNAETSTLQECVPQNLPHHFN
jgi:hypothetical protein